MADGDVALHGEGGDGARGRVDAQVLEVGDAQAARVAEHPLAEQGFGDVGQSGGRQDHQVSRGQAHQVAVGRGAHVLGGQHHQYDHHVADYPHSANEGHKKHADHLVFDRVVGPNAQGLVVPHRRVVLHSRVVHCEVFHGRIARLFFVFRRKSSIGRKSGEKNPRHGTKGPRNARRSRNF